MAGIILVFGSPGSGKTPLAGNLEASYGFGRIEVDSVYVQFVRAKYPSSVEHPVRHPSPLPTAE
jgi:predicted kinase